MFHDFDNPPFDEFLQLAAAHPGLSDLVFDWLEEASDEGKDLILKDIYAFIRDLDVAEGE